jgi:glycosyltransferase involved in cell wall biosynthesis
MPSISLVVIAYNEAEKIERCLKSAMGIADEMVVVDSGSTDGTVAICERMGARVVHQPFLGYIEQKNFAANLATRDYILSLDADEALSHPLVAWLEKAKPTLNYDTYVFNRLNNYSGSWIKHGDYYPDKKLRLWRKGTGYWGGENPHDKVIVFEGATVERIKHDILHWSFSSRSEHKAQMIRFSEIAARAMHEKKKRVGAMKPYLSAVWSFVNGYIFKAGFLDGSNGFHIALMNAFYSFRKYTLLMSYY